MIVTGQHSFPFSSAADSENGYTVSLNSEDGLSFAKMLEQTDNRYDLSLNRAISRNEEILNESVLNENNGYRVVVGENGNPVSEQSEKSSVSSQPVADAGAPHSKAARSSRAADKSESNQISRREVRDQVAVADKTGKQQNKRETLPVDKKSTLETPKEAVAALSHADPSGVKTSFSKKKQVQSELTGQKQILSTVKDVFENNGERNDLQPVKLSALRGQTENIKSEKNHSDSLHDANKTGLKETASRQEGERLERIVTVSVLRSEDSKNEQSGEANPKNQKKNTIAVSKTEQQTVSIENGSGSVDSLSSLFQQGKEFSVSKESPLQQLTKADLIRELKEQGSSEILREARILVKDGQSGEIKMVLRPQELGTVKINLILENKHIVGKIFVDNNIVKEALQTAFGDLKEVFAEQGMELGALDVYVSQESKGEHGFESEESIDVTPLKIAGVTGAVEKHAVVIRDRMDRSGIDIEV